MLAWQNKLRDDAALLGLDLSAASLEKFSTYVQLLSQWNKAYNLTAIDDLEEIRVLHILDSLTIAPYIVGPHVLDVGSGAGFPGIPLALVLPHEQFTLLDSNSKKTRFLRHVVMMLKLPNVQIVEARMEKFIQPICFNTIVTRATSSMLDIIIATKDLLCEKGQWLFMKGKLPQDEIAELERFVLNTNSGCCGTNRPEQFEVRRGGDELASGVYKDVHEERERGSQQSITSKCDGYIIFAVTIEAQSLKIPHREISRHVICVKKQPHKKGAKCG